MSLGGRVALVTGAGQGLGRAFSEILLKNGAKVMLTDINETVGQKTLSELAVEHKSKVAFAKCDITKVEDLKSAFSAAKSKLGIIDIMVNNAGIGNAEGEGWEATIDINVKGTIKGTTLALDNLRKDKGGKGGVIINVASLAGLNPNPCGPVYGASKAAIIMFSQCWGLNPDVTSNGVRINVLAPAFADTNLVRKLNTSEAVVLRPDIAAKMTEMVGVMPVEEVAEALLELVTDESKSNAILKVSAKTGKVYHSFT